MENHSLHASLRLEGATLLPILVLAVMLSGAAVGSNPAPASHGPGAVDQMTRQVKGLLGGTVIILNVGNTPGEPVCARVPFDGTWLTVVLEPHSVRADNYQVLVQREDGSLVAAEPSPMRTLRGVVSEVPGSLVAAALLHEGLYAAIQGRI